MVAIQCLAVERAVSLSSVEFAAHPSRLELLLGILLASFHITPARAAAHEAQLNDTCDQSAACSDPHESEHLLANKWFKSKACS